VKLDPRGLDLAIRLFRKGINLGLPGDRPYRGSAGRRGQEGKPIGVELCTNHVCDGKEMAAILSLSSRWRSVPTSDGLSVGPENALPLMGLSGRKFGR
jgi:hypothetical protein